jgi:death-on-curing protein
MSHIPEPETLYLTLADLLDIHQVIIDRTSASYAPLRDERLLESALSRPRMAAHYERADFVRQAALLAVGISQAQAFVDGNKRTAYAAAETFLELNGLEFVGQPIEMAQQLEAVASRGDGLDAATDRFEAWLRGRVGPRST